MAAFLYDLKASPQSEFLARTDAGFIVAVTGEDFVDHRIFIGTRVVGGVDHLADRPQAANLGTPTSYTSGKPMVL